MARPRFLTLAAAATAVYLLNRRWNQRFEVATVARTPVADANGTAVTGRTITIQSILDAPPATVWTAVQTPRLLAHVAYPLLTFVPRTAVELPPVWRQGETAELALRGFGMLPLGTHDIFVEQIDDAQRCIRTREHGAIASVWNHRIQVEPFGAHQTRYTDEVELFAGRLTTAVAGFAHFFYRYRQTRWQHLAPTLNKRDPVGLP